VTAKTREVVVGAVFVGALTLLGIFTIIVGNYNPFAPPEKLWVFFNDVGGLRKGNVVRIAGLEEGQVKEMWLARHGVLAELTVSPDVVLHDGYTVTVRSFSPLGGKFVDIERGNLGAPVVRSVEPREKEGEPEVEALRGYIEPEFISEISDLAAKVKPLMVTAVANIRDVTAKINNMEGSLGRLVGDPELYEHLVKASANLDRATQQVTSLVDKVNNGTGTLAKLVNDPALYDATTGTMERVRSLAGKVDDGKGAVGALFNDDRVRDSLARTIEHIEAILAAADKGEGTIGRLVRDEKLYENLTGALADLRKTTQMIADARGPLGVLINDEQAGEQLRRTIEHIERVTDAIAMGKGSLGRFVMDDRLITEAERVIVEVRESVEDLREQAAINAFVVAVFQAF
jgi:phospholipid/cholesterol/gamma-HCH transport system substrate-binding protein